MKYSCTLNGDMSQVRRPTSPTAHKSDVHKSDGPQVRCPRPQVRRPTSPMSTSPMAHKCDVHKSDGPQVRRPQVRRPTSPMTTSPMSVCATVLDTYERKVETTFVGLKLTQKCCFSRHCSINCKWKWYNLDVFWVIFIRFLCWA